MFVKANIRSHQHHVVPAVASEAEVQYFETAVEVDNDIGWLQVSVDYPGLVQVVDSTEHLIEQKGHSFMINFHLYDLS